MNEENFSDGFKEANEVADGMIPDSQIVKILDQISSAKDQNTTHDQPAKETGLFEKHLDVSLMA